MMCNRLKLLALLLLAGSLHATGELTITNPELSQDCAQDDIRVVEENGALYIAAFFTNMDAIAENKTIDKKRCTMKYNVQVAPGYKLDVFQFSVDGVYQLSEHGTGRLTVSHRVVNNTSARTTKFFQSIPGDPTSLTGDIHDFTGAITKDQLPPQYGTCGSSIPLTTSIYAEAVKPQSDMSGLTRVSLDEAVSSHYSSPYVKLCRVVVNPCN